MTAIQQALCALADEAYRDFQSALLPTVEKERILGVRTPVLRRYAKATGGRRRWWQSTPHRHRALPHAGCKATGNTRCGLGL